MNATVWKRMGAAALLLAMTEGMNGCLVAGYSSGGGFFVWPGSLAITVILLVVFFFLRRGR